MNYFLKSIKLVAVGGVALLIGILAVNAFGQDKDKFAKVKKAEYKTADGNFCRENYWSDEKRSSFFELRETKIPATGSINVNGGQNGGIAIRGEDRSDIVVRACVQAWGETEEAAKAAVANIKIETAGEIKAVGNSDEHGSVSFQIIVPRNTDLSLTAHNGGIAITGTDGKAEFTTKNGGVSLSNVAGDIKGRTTNGGVNVSLAGTTWKGTGLDLVTTNGGVRLALPENYAAHVELGTTNGGFNSGIPALAMEKSDKTDWYSRSRKIDVDLNGGGPTVRVITTNGGVKIDSLE